MAAPLTMPYALKLARRQGVIVGCHSGRLIVDLVRGAEPAPAIRAKLKENAAEVIRFLAQESQHPPAEQFHEDTLVDLRWFDRHDPIPVPVHDLTSAEVRALARSDRKFHVEPTPLSPTGTDDLPACCRHPGVCSRLGPCDFAPTCSARGIASQTPRGRGDASPAGPDPLSSYSIGGGIRRKEFIHHG